MVHEVNRVEAPHPCAELSGGGEVRSSNRNLFFGYRRYRR